MNEVVTTACPFPIPELRATPHVSGDGMAPPCLDVPQWEFALLHRVDMSPEPPHDADRTTNHSITVTDNHGSPLRDPENVIVASWDEMRQTLAASVSVDGDRNIERSVQSGFVASPQLLRPHVPCVMIRSWTTPRALGDVWPLPTTLRSPSEQWRPTPRIQNREAVSLMFAGGRSWPRRHACQHRRSPEEFTQMCKTSFLRSTANGRIVPLVVAVSLFGCSKADVVSPDTVPPSAPTNLVAEAVSSTTINLSWSASTDGGGVAGYQVYRDGVYLKSISFTQTTDGPLTPNTQYCYAVSAKDESGNESQKSAQSCTTTLSSAPTTPTNLVAEAVSSTMISLSWSASTDDVGVAGYKVNRGGVYLKSVSATQTTDEPLTTNTQYCYTVSAYDESGNESENSAQSCATTLEANRMITSLGYDDWLPETGGYQQIVGDMIAVRFTPTEYPFHVGLVRFNVVQWGDDHSDILLLNMYNDGGGAPGTALLEGVPVSLTTTATYQNWNAWVEVDLSSYGLTVLSGDLYVALEWTVSNSPRIGMDRSAPIDDRTWIYENGMWQKLSTAYGVSEDAMIRLVGTMNSSTRIESLFYDDNLPETGGYQQIVGDMIAVRFTPTEYPFHVGLVRFNVVQWGDDHSDILLLNMYNDGGGAPGTALLEGVPVSLTTTATYQNWNAWVEVDLSSYGLTVLSGDLYVALEWTVSNSPRIGMDRSAPIDDRTWIYENGMWQKLSTAYGVSEDAMIRLVGAF